MGQFPVTPERERILAKIPDYAVAISPAGRHVTVRYRGETVAESDNALLVQETRHQDVFYLPREDVDMAQFTPTDHSTFCPFKGHASYWTLKTGAGEEANVVWSYEDPYPEVVGLKDYMSFYTDRTGLTVT